MPFLDEQVNRSSSAFSPGGPATAGAVEVAVAVVEAVESELLFVEVADADADELARLEGV